MPTQTPEELREELTNSVRTLLTINSEIEERRAKELEWWNQGTWEDAFSEYHRKRTEWEKRTQAELTEAQASQAALRSELEKAKDQQAGLEKALELVEQRADSLTAEEAEAVAEVQQLLRGNPRIMQAFAQDGMLDGAKACAAAQTVEIKGMVHTKRRSVEESIKQVGSAVKKDMLTKFESVKEEGEKQIREFRQERQGAIQTYREEFFKDIKPVNEQLQALQKAYKALESLVDDATTKHFEELQTTKAKSAALQEQLEKKVVAEKDAIARAKKSEKEVEQQQKTIKQQASKFEGELLGQMATFRSRHDRQTVLTTSKLEDEIEDLKSDRDKLDKEVKIKAKKIAELEDRLAEVVDDRNVRAKLLDEAEILRHRDREESAVRDEALAFRNKSLQRNVEAFKGQVQLVMAIGKGDLEDLRLQNVAVRCELAWAELVQAAKETLPEEAVRLEEEPNWKGEFLTLQRRVLELEQAADKELRLSSDRTRHENVLQSWESVRFPSDVAEGVLGSKASKKLLELQWLACKCDRPFRLPTAYFADAAQVSFQEHAWLLGHVAAMLQSFPTGVIAPSEPDSGLVAAGSSIPAGLTDGSPSLSISRNKALSAALMVQSLALASYVVEVFRQRCSTSALLAVVGEESHRLRQELKQMLSYWPHLAGSIFLCGYMDLCEERTCVPWSSALRVLLSRHDAEASHMLVLHAPETSAEVQMISDVVEGLCCLTNRQETAGTVTSWILTDEHVEVISENTTVELVPKEACRLPTGWTKLRSQEPYQYMSL